MHLYSGMNTCRYKITMSAAADKGVLLQTVREYQRLLKANRIQIKKLRQTAAKKDKVNRGLQSLAQRQTGLIVKLEGKNKGLRKQLDRKNGVHLALVEMLGTSKAKRDWAEDQRNRALALRNEWRRKYDEAREATENLQQQGQQQTEKTRKAEAKLAETEAKLAETEAKLVETKNELESTQV